MRIYIDEMSGKVPLKEKKVTKYVDMEFTKLSEEKRNEINAIWEHIDLSLQGKSLSSAVSALMSAVCWQLWNNGISEEDATMLFCQSYRSGSKSWEKIRQEMAEKEDSPSAFKYKSIKPKKLAVCQDEC